MKPPICHIHHCPMVPRQERVPFASFDADRAKGARRIAWRCPVMNGRQCPSVAVGEEEYAPLQGQLRFEERVLVQL
jgi:hypothetical protein